MNSTQIALRKKVFNVDSKYRTNGSNSNFNIKLNMPMRHNFNTVVPLSVEIPKTFYMLDADTVNTITVESPIGSVIGTPLTFKSGVNYSFNQLRTELKDILNVAPFNTGVWDVTFKQNSNHYKISNDTATFKLTFTGSKEIARYYGFEQASYSSSVSGPLNILESVNYVNFQRYDFFVIRSNIALNNNNNKLATVYPASYGEGAVIKFTPVDAYTTSVGMSNNRSNDFNFVLEDGDTGNLINLNGSNWRMTFTCEEIVLPAVPIPQ